jgi:hypothetical protein
MFGLVESRFGSVRFGRPVRNDHYPSPHLTILSGVLLSNKSTKIAKNKVKKQNKKEVAKSD